MELGQGGITTLTFVPEYDGNRSAPEDQRFSVQVKPLRAADQMGHMNETPERLLVWRDDALKAWLDNAEFGPQIRRFSSELLLTMRLFVEQVTAPRGFFNNGTPVEIARRPHRRRPRSLRVRYRRTARPLPTPRRRRPHRPARRHRRARMDLERMPRPIHNRRDAQLATYAPTAVAGCARHDD